MTRAEFSSVNIAHTEVEYYKNPSAPYQQIDGRWLHNEYYGEYRPIFSLDYNSAPLVTVVDDNLFALYYTMGRVLEAGFRTKGFQPSQEYKWNFVGIRGFAEQISRFAAGAIMDKSLGANIDGIELARMVTEHTPTIMLTGEPNTRETHRVTTAYIERGHKPEELIKLLYETTFYTP